MQELRLVGVHEDGGHLLLSGEEGTSYRLPIDDALRTASSRAFGGPTTGNSTVPPRTVQDEPRRKPPKPPVPLTPRDIQSRIRTGATAEQVAAESGLDLAHVQRYEGPVRAERDYVAYLAQRVEVATPLPSHDGYRSAFGDSPALLGDMVSFRVQSYGIDPASLEWDSWRRPDGSWHVEASFDLPEESQVDLGEQPPARWTYNPTRKTVTNGNRWAQVLSELEPLDGPLPSRRLSAVADRVFDFEAEKEDEAQEPSAADQDGLLDVLRSRRGQRLGADEDGDDALAELLTRGAIPAAHPRNDDVPDQDAADSDPADSDPADSDSAGSDAAGRDAAGRDAAGRDAADQQDEEDAPVPGLALAPPAAEDVPESDAAAPEHHDDGTPRLYDGVSTETREISVFAKPSRRLQPPAAPRQETGKSPAVPPGRDGAGRESGRQPAKDGRIPAANTGRDAGVPGRDTGKDSPEVSPERRGKPKRSSVPSWDDIVFGRKSD